MCNCLPPQLQFSRKRFSAISVTSLPCVALLRIIFYCMFFLLLLSCLLPNSIPGDDLKRLRSDIWWSVNCEECLCPQFITLPILIACNGL